VKDGKVMPEDGYEYTMDAATNYESTVEGISI
jgi:hypothetical protein